MVREQDSVLQVLGLMNGFGVQYLPVAGENELIGIISSHEIRLGMALLKNAQTASGRPVSVADLCKREIYQVSPSTPVPEIADKLGEGLFELALVVENGRVLGIITPLDVCKWVGKQGASNLGG